MDPLVRGRHVQEWLERVEREPDPFRARFFELIPAATRAEIDAAPRLGWVPARLHVELSEVMLEAFGPKRAHDYYRRAFTDALRGPIFDGLIKTGVRILGVTPGVLLRWAHKGWEASFKNCGVVEGRVLEPGRGELLYSALPSVCTSSSAWLDSAQGSAYGALDLFGADGIVRIDTSGRDRGEMRLDLEWRE
ncbi:MAG: hypothetical protein ACXWUG_12500 [Polyangiales bacterium]